MTPLQKAMSAVRASPKDPAAWVKLGDLLRQEGQQDKAQQSYQRALQLDPLNEAAQRGLVAAVTNAEPPPSAVPSSPPPGPNVGSSAPEPSAERPALPAALPEAPRERQERPKRLDTAPRPTISVANSLGVTARATGARAYPPRSQKPTPARMWTGLIVLFGVPLLCLCVVLLTLISRAF